MDLQKRVFITGATGFVGNSIAREFQSDKQFEIFGLSREKSVDKSNFRRNSIEMFSGDVTNYQTLEKLESIENIKVLIHTAGLAHQFGKTRKEDFWRVNVKGTENICKLAIKLKIDHFILISSVSVYGATGESLVDESYICQPEGAYAESKLESEQKAIDICQKSGIDLTVLRLGTVIGEGDRGNVARLISLIDRGLFFWIGEGNNKKSLIYKSDVAKAVKLLAENKKPNKTEIFNLTAEAIPMKEIVIGISESLKRKTPRIKISPGLFEKIFHFNNKVISTEYLKKIEKVFLKWLSNDIYSEKKLRKDYNFQTQVSISRAISKQVSYYLKQKSEINSTN